MSLIIALGAGVAWGISYLRTDAIRLIAAPTAPPPLVLPVERDRSTRAGRAIIRRSEMAWRRAQTASVDVVHRRGRLHFVVTGDLSDFFRPEDPRRRTFRAMGQRMEQAVLPADQSANGWRLAGFDFSASSRGAVSGWSIAIPHWAVLVASGGITMLAWWRRRIRGGGFPVMLRADEG